MLSSHLLLGLPNGLFPSVLPLDMPHASPKNYSNMTTNQGRNSKTRVKWDIPAKSHTFMSTSSLLDNVYTAKSCKGGKRVPDALKLGLVS
jgi:hypothetical protein